MQKKAQTCPYLDLDDVRCSNRLTMSHLAEAYRLCFGRPADCPVYNVLQTQCGDCSPAAQEACAA